MCEIVELHKPETSKQKQDRNTGKRHPRLDMVPARGPNNSTTDSPDDDIARLYEAFLARSSAG